MQDGLRNVHSSMIQRCENPKRQQYSTTCDFDYINEVVFLTREEAEQKLKEMESDNKSGKG